MVMNDRTKGIAIVLLGVLALAVLLTMFEGKSGIRLSTGSVMMQTDGSSANWLGAEESARGVAYDMVSAPAGMPAPDMDASFGEAKIGIMPPMQPSAGPTAADVEQRVIKNASLNLVVDSVQEGIDRISVIAVAQKGFVQQSSVNERGDGTFSGYVTIRVPSDMFEAAMTEIKGIANVVKSESVSGQDVTEQYTDLEARLRNAKAQETTYLAILNRATSVEDILAVQRELSNVRYQIEALEGQRQYLENQTSFSTISVSLAEEAAVRLPTKEFRPVTSMKEAAQALVRVFQAMLVGLIWLVIIGIGVLIPFVLFWWIVFLVARAAWRKYLGMTPPRKR